MKLLIFALVALLAAVTYQYQCTCSQNMCTNIPANHQYYLTDFCGPATTACGKSCGNCKWYYSADYKRFGCIAPAFFTLFLGLRLHVFSQRARDSAGSTPHYSSPPPQICPPAHLLALPEFCLGTPQFISSGPLRLNRWKHNSLLPWN